MPDPRHSDSPLLAKAILCHVAEDGRGGDGWCRWSTKPDWPWEFGDYKPLVERGLLERRESWSDILLKLTPAGWIALFAAPATELPEEARTDVLGQVAEGDVLP